MNGYTFDIPPVTTSDAMLYKLCSEITLCGNSWC